MKTGIHFNKSAELSMQMVEEARIIWANEPYGVIPFGSTFVDSVTGATWTIPAVPFPNGATPMVLEIGAYGQRRSGYGTAANQVISMTASVADLINGATSGEAYDPETDCIEICTIIDQITLPTPGDHAYVSHGLPGAAPVVNTYTGMVLGFPLVKRVLMNTPATVNTDEAEVVSASIWSYRVAGAMFVPRYGTDPDASSAWEDLVPVVSTRDRWSMPASPTAVDIDGVNLFPDHAIVTIIQPLGAGPNPTHTIRETIIRRWAAG